MKRNDYKHYVIMAYIVNRISKDEYADALKIIEHVRGFDEETKDPVQWREDMKRLEELTETLRGAWNEIIDIVKYWEVK